MAKKDIKFTLDTIDSRYSPVGTVKQLDSVFFYIKITENGVTKDLTGQTIKLFAIKEDKKIVEQTTKINITNQREGLVEIELLNAAIQVHGFTYFELEISDSNGIISTSDFILRVNKRVGSNEAIESTNEVATLKKIEEYVAQAKVELQNFKKLQTFMLETNNSMNNQEDGRVEAERLRVEAENGRVTAETKREEFFNGVEGRITANTEELKTARTATSGENFNSLDERIDCEVDRLNKKIEVSFLQQEDREDHELENTIKGMTTEGIIKGRTLLNIFPIEPLKLTLGNTTIHDDVFIIEARSGSYSNIWDSNNPLYKEETEYTVIIDILENTLIQNEPSESNSISVGGSIDSVFGENTFFQSVDKGFTGQIIGKLRTISNFSTIPTNCGARIFLSNGFDGGILKLKISIIEGDLVDKPIPKYFKGIDSFSKLEKKIIFKTHNENLFNYKTMYSNWWVNGEGTLITEDLEKYSILVPIKDTYKNLFLKCKNANRANVGFLDKNNTLLGYGVYGVSENIKINTPPKGANKILIYLNSNGFNTSEDNGIMLSQCDLPYRAHEEYRKEILLNKYGFEEGLMGIENIADELDSIRNLAIKRIGKRGYREGDLLLKNVITDKVNTYYILEEPIETTLTENINVKIFDRKTYVNFENNIPGISTFKAPMDTTATIARLSSENRTLEEKNKNLRQNLESTVLKLTDSDLELVKQNVDMDFRLMEVEFALDIPQTILSSDINFKNKKGEVKTMARTPYEMMKIVILSGDYDREDYMHKVGKYYERGRMTKEEHDELMSLMTADEVLSK
ncbi:BppU family phage baseplate upper protein [Clostridium perfringens]|nr:BppU family phage baseplate upper protein [Clostridium perfringens]